MLTARIGVAYVQGLQRCGVAATVKHFVGNDSETERMTVDVRIDERTLRELYLAPFEAIVREAGPVGGDGRRTTGSTGRPMTESALLRDILHRELRLRRPGHVGLDRDPVRRSGARCRARPGHARARERGRPVGRRAGRARSARARSRGA